MTRRPLKSLIQGTLGALNDERRKAVLDEIKTQLSAGELAAVLLLAPFRRSTWQFVDDLDDAGRQKYWKEIAPGWIVESDDENNEAVERLLAAQRPRAAFASVHFQVKTIKVALLFRLLSEIPKDGNDQPGQYQLGHHDLERMFALIDASPEITLEQKAGLELLYVDVLSRPWGQQRVTAFPTLKNISRPIRPFSCRRLSGHISAPTAVKTLRSGADPAEIERRATLLDISCWREFVAYLATMILVSSRRNCSQNG